MNTPADRTRQIILTICAKHGVGVRDVLSDCRLKHIAKARQEAMAAVYAEGRLSLPQVGRYFNRDHTTVLHAIRRVAQRSAA